MQIRAYMCRGKRFGGAVDDLYNIIYEILSLRVMQLYNSIIHNIWHVNVS